MHLFNITFNAQILLSSIVFVSLDLSVICPYAIKRSVCSLLGHFSFKSTSPGLSVI